MIFNLVITVFKDTTKTPISEPFKVQVYLPGIRGAFINNPNAAMKVFSGFPPLTLKIKEETDNLNSHITN